jgi:2-amino-4-hydroxy-6-hydroxymethyldihydropteridine diphosphokinase
MTRVAIGLGSNLGDRLDHLRYAIDRLASMGRDLVVSPLYETTPVGGPDQAPYLNVVATLETDMDSEALLDELLVIEGERKRSRNVHWGPRTLDLDLLLYGGSRIDEERLTVPHPRLHQRRFVLEPLLAVWPDAILPDGTPVASFEPAVADQTVAEIGPFPVVAVAPGGFGARGGWWVAGQMVLLAGFLVMLALDRTVLPGGSIRGVFGGLAAAAGAVQSVLGVLHLGTNLTPYPEPAELGDLVHGGMYRYVRHPIYGGITLGMVGAALVTGGAVALALALTGGVFFWLKAGFEERRLERRYPGYGAYRSVTPRRMIPYLF